MVTRGGIRTKDDCNRTCGYLDQWNRSHPLPVFQCYSLFTLEFVGHDPLFLFLCTVLSLSISWTSALSLAPWSFLSDSLQHFSLRPDRSSSSPELGRFLCFFLASIPWSTPSGSSFGYSSQCSGSLGTTCQHRSSPSHMSAQDLSHIS